MIEPVVEVCIERIIHRGEGYGIADWREFDKSGGDRRLWSRACQLRRAGRPVLRRLYSALLLSPDCASGDGRSAASRMSSSHGQVTVEYFR